MLRPALKKLFVMAAVAVAVVSISAQPSQAWCGHHWGWGRYYGHHYGWGYVGCHSYYYYPVVYSSCYNPCGWGRSWGCYRPCWSSCGALYYGTCHSYCCNPCCKPVTDCEGAVVEPKADEPAPTEPAPAEPTAPEPPAAAEPAPSEPAPAVPEPASVLPDASKPAPAAPDMPPILPPPPKDALNRANSGNGLLSVIVPEDARVYVNGMLTQTPGTYRRYVSRGLVPGYSYTYEVRVMLNRDGKVVSDSKVVQLRAGQSRDVSFDLQRSSPEVDPAVQLTASTR